MCPKAVPRHLQNHVVRSRVLKYSVKSFVTIPSTKCYFQCGSSCMIQQNKSTVVSVWTTMVSWFCVRPICNMWFLKAIQVTVKHDPFDATQESMQTLHPSSCNHIWLVFLLRHLYLSGSLCDFVRLSIKTCSLKRFDIR